MTDLLSIAGFILAILGSALGLLGAWCVSSDYKPLQHLGYTFWLWNSPMIVISLIGIATGTWQDLNAWAFVPLNLCYWGTAWRGWRNTR